MNPSTNQTPLDYLNQIAPQAPKRPVFAWNIRTILLAGVAAIVLVIILVNVAGAIANAQKQPWQRLYAKLDATSSVVNDSSTRIKNSQLRSLNSDLKLYITNTQRDLAAPLANLNIVPKKIPASVLALESNTDMKQRLEIGRLNAKFDSTYAREMTYQVATILALLQQLYSAGAGPQTQAFLKTAYNNLGPTYTALSKFSASNE